MNSVQWLAVFLGGSLALVLLAGCAGWARRQIIGPSLDPDIPLSSANVTEDKHEGTSLDIAQERFLVEFVSGTRVFRAVREEIDGKQYSVIRCAVANMAEKTMREVTVHLEMRSRQKTKRLRSGVTRTTAQRQVKFDTSPLTLHPRYQDDFIIICSKEKEGDQPPRVCMGAPNEAKPDDWLDAGGMHHIKVYVAAVDILTEPQMFTVFSSSDGELMAFEVLHNNTVLVISKRSAKGSHPRRTSGEPLRAHNTVNVSRPPFRAVVKRRSLEDDCQMRK